MIDCESHIDRKNPSKYWICNECAIERGGVLFAGQRFTASESICGWCNGVKQLDKFIIPMRDFIWKNGIPKT